MAHSDWSDDALYAARHEADPEVDQLVHQVLGAPDDSSIPGNQAYNVLLDIADKLVEAPELALVPSSSLATQLQQYPQPLVNYFAPMAAPEWVDPSKLQQASTLWHKNMLGIIGVLYAASLPACYLIRNGIPALYRSSKLKEHTYIYQRIYETGLFLDDVLSKNGLHVINDLENAHTRRDQLTAVLNTLDPESKWFHVGHTVMRAETSTQLPAPRHVAEEVHKQQLRCRRYIWGKGFISAKKVRFLHASMRFMLTAQTTSAALRTQPGQPATIAQSLSDPTTPWDHDAWGLPVNQADLAYTLLTFAYLIPYGLERWGCVWTREEKDAFLHLWKTIGYILGIKESLLTDTWEEAEALFIAIRQQQAGPCEAGKELTTALMRFLQDYLPPSLDTHLPPLLIASQLGTEYADMLFTPVGAEVSRQFLPRLKFRVALGFVRLYYFVRNRIFRRFETIAALMGSVFSQAGDALVDSWRDVYARRPFYVAVNATMWTQIKGVREDYKVRLQAWRNKLFATLALGLGFLVAASVGLVVFVGLLLLRQAGGAHIAAWITGGCILAALFVLQVSVPRVSRRRPKIPDPF